ncbi:MAG: tetratricopeptide repeat protein [Leptolyngbyaceae cyanobacterium bins.59]|nr:tetratricopeptide repeat protein [Leptolyngbyaceae cyanobacterium bins.59]
MNAKHLKLVGISGVALAGWLLCFHFLPAPKGSPITTILWYFLSLMVGLSLVYGTYHFLIKPQQSDTPIAVNSVKSRSIVTNESLESADHLEDFDYLQQAIEQAKATQNTASGTSSDTFSPPQVQKAPENPPPPTPVESVPIATAPDPALIQEKVKEMINQGVQKAASNDHWAAISKFNQAVRLDGNHAIAYYNRSLSYLKLNYGEEALQDCCKAIQLNPSYAKAYNCRGNIRKQRGDLRGACADYQQALEIDPNFSGARQNLEKVQARLQAKTSTKKKG